MRIIELNAVEFGCLKDKKITLGGKLNILSGENESGKSTLMLFIKFMLYGLPRRSAKTATEIERALSWDNHRAAGTMLVESAGKQYLIERRAVMGTKISETHKFTDLSTGETIDGVAGEVLLGVPCEVFESSCFISQLRTTDLSRAQVSGAIENILVSADESIDVARILERIDKVRKEYRLNRGEGGLLYDTEQQISALKSKYRDAVEKHLAYNEMKARLERTQSNIQKVSSSYEASKNMLEDVNRAVLIRRFDELAAQEESLNGTRDVLARLEDSVRYDGFVADEAHVGALISAQKSVVDAEEQAKKRAEDARRVPKVSDKTDALAAVGEAVERQGGKTAATANIRVYDQKRRKQKGVGTALAVLGSVCIAAAALIFVLATLAPAIAAGAAGLALIAAGLAAFIGASKSKRNRDAACGQYGVGFEELDEYLERCLIALGERRDANTAAISANARLGAAEETRDSAKQRLCALLGKTTSVSDESINSLSSLALAEIRRLGEFCREKKQLSEKIFALNMLVDKSRAELDGYDEKALREAVCMDVSALTPQTVENAKKKERYDRERLELLHVEFNNLRESLAALKAGLTATPVEIADRVCELEQKLAKDTEYYDALMLAKERIERASEAMSGSFTPEISRIAGELMATVSQGQHTSVQTTKNLDLSVEQDGFLVNADVLSGGTRDAAYICLRIALMLRLFGTELPPLIMDESLCQLDDSRAKNVLAMLLKLSQTTQCILFTCHSREAQLCSDFGDARDAGDAGDAGDAFCHFSFKKEK